MCLNGLQSLQTLHLGNYDSGALEATRVQRSTGVIGYVGRSYTSSCNKNFSRNVLRCCLKWRVMSSGYSNFPEWRLRICILASLRSVVHHCPNQYNKLSATCPLANITIRATKYKDEKNIHVSEKLITKLLECIENNSV